MSGNAFEESTETLASQEELKNFSGQVEWVVGFPAGTNVHIGGPRRPGEAETLSHGASERSLEDG